MTKLLLFATALIMACVGFSQSDTAQKNTTKVILKNGVQSHKSTGVEQRSKKESKETSVQKQVHELSLDECLNSISYVKSKIDVLKSIDASTSELSKYDEYLEQLNARISSLKSVKQ